MAIISDRVDGEQILRKPLFLNIDAAGGQCDSRLSIKFFFGIGKLSQATVNQINRGDYDS